MYNLMGDQRPLTSTRKRKLAAQATKPQEEPVQAEPQRMEEASPTQLLTHSSSVEEVSIFAS